MKQKIIHITGIITLGVLLTLCVPHQSEESSPNVILTSQGVSDIRNELGKLPLLDKSYDRWVKVLEDDMALGVNVPVPKDPAGGYTHNRHKQNYISMYGAGLLWQLSGDEKYAIFVKDMLLEYADMYPSLGAHPVEKSYARGKLFWQQLNEAVWLVYTSQAYDCIKSYLSEEDRKKIEADLLIPYANLLSVESTYVFNRIHNHAVWAAAGVGMAGYAMDNEEMVHRALFGIETEEHKDKPKGYYAQLDLLFSPDGYYTEGPYYQRYALLPYVLFAQAIENNNPAYKIFEYRGQILRKATLVTLQMTNTDGKFMPFNDALKDMSFRAPELINAVNIVYNEFPESKQLLSVAKAQGRVALTQAGLRVAKDLNNGEAQPFQWLSMELNDGADGKQGAVGILRADANKDAACVVMKYAQHGMGHGHFDRLGIMMYDNGNEILSDYGAARYVNVEYKHGGRYLPENKTWAKHTVAHNTVVMDKTTQFNGDYKTADKVSGEKWFFNIENEHISIMSAKENNAYGSAQAQRTVAVIKDKDLFEFPLVVDVFKIDDDKKHTYDLPFYYKGKLLYTNADYTNFTTQRGTMGDDFGYQHLWKEGQGKASTDNFQTVWFNEGRFYTMTTEAQADDEIFYTRIGANDPEFSLRNETGLLFRRSNQSSTCFASALEVHGNKNFDTELVENQVGIVKGVKTLLNNKAYTIVEIQTVKNSSIVLAISNSTNAPSEEHNMNIADKQYTWKGPYKLFKK
ncbi:heparinase II/III domain-containing protein [Labilibacter marinus]|uniref:heparinase II/III domain-containing protein n=1 Tax=Labilibacter marinus TaxID=1477105 RepID=UPI0008360143|nr:heparinase II/III family protein [Labilibacter marinus]